ncbi:MAG TPA: hypothetical protein VFK42_07140 [Acidimicrobiales bacterium]|nr:hypothetical protein [Acidimicrobiales bacterium]
MTTTAARWDPDRLAALEYERAVLARELREVDDQRARDEIDADQHAALVFDLRMRAAAIQRDIGNGRDRRPARRRRSRRGLVAIVTGLAGTAALLAWMLAGQVAPRVGSTAAPAAAESSVDARAQRLAAVVERRPDDAPARLAYARILLEQRDLRGALVQYDAAARIEPANAEALAYGGWVAVLTGDPGGGLARLDRAVAADASYADAHALRGLTLVRANDRAAASAELRRYLDLAPDGPLAAQVAAVVDRLGGEP